MNRVKVFLLFLASFFLFLSCFGYRLNPGAGQVQILSQDSDVKKCNFVSRINTGNNRVESYQDAQIILRNLAFQMGANAIFIEDIQSRKIATAKALKCPEKVLESALYNLNTTNESSTNRNTNSSNDNILIEGDQNSTSQLLVDGETVKSGSHVWQRCSYGQFMANQTCQGTSAPLQWRSAMKYCTDLNLQGKSWKLPSTGELQSLLVKNAGEGIKLDSRIFPRSEASLYWTSSVYDASNQVAWAVDFKSGTSFAYGIANTAYVRCISLN